MTIRSLVLSVFILFVPQGANASGIPVVDVAAIAQLLRQIQQGMEMIETLQSQYKMLKNYAKLDHEGLASRKFGRFLADYQNQFDAVLKQIDGYQNMFDQISRLDQVYTPYHEGWDEEENQLLKTVKKEILWTRIQMKHAAKVGAEIRKMIPQSQDQLDVLMDDNAQAGGALLAAQVGNQIMGVVGKNLSTLNVQMNEFLQAYSAKSLEENQARGLIIRRLDDAVSDLGEYPHGSPAPRSPIRVLR